MFTLCIVYTYFRRCMYTRRRYKHWSTLSLVQLHITSMFGRPLHPHIVLSVKDYSGAWLDKGSGVRNVGSNVTRSARISWMPIVYKVSNMVPFFLQFLNFFFGVCFIYSFIRLTYFHISSFFFGLCL